MKSKKETLEEASIRLVPNRILKTPFGTPYEITPTMERNIFKKGAQWQAERMYSEEDMIEFGNKMQIVSDVDFDGNIKFAFTPSEYFEQFKNNKNGK
jgi:hypothetical protein